MSQRANKMDRAVSGLDLRLALFNGIARGRMKYCSRSPVLSLLYIFYFVGRISDRWDSQGCQMETACELGGALHCLT